MGKNELLKSRYGEYIKKKQFTILISHIKNLYYTS